MPTAVETGSEVCAVPCFKQELVAEIKASLPSDQDVQKTAVLYNALSDATRLKILFTLSKGELCVCDVSHVVGLSVSATSHQLRVLRNIGLVSYRNDGRMAYYSLHQESPLCPWVEQALRRLE